MQINCPNCNSENTRSTDNEPLQHSSQEEVAKGEMRYDFEVYVMCTCDDCKEDFKEVFDLKPRKRKIDKEAVITKKIQAIVEKNGGFIDWYDVKEDQIIQLKKTKKSEVLVEQFGMKTALAIVFVDGTESSSYDVAYGNLNIDVLLRIHEQLEIFENNKI